MILLHLSAIAVLLLAGPDNNVEWNGVSHVPWLDRTPVCPIGGQSFVVRFQAYADDLTSARVFVRAGSVQWITASRTGRRGPYDIWSAAVPASSAGGTVEYYFELVDGSDTDYLGPQGMSDDPPAAGWIVDFATLSHAPLGATLTSDGGAVFRVWAPGATSAYVAGDFNGWNTTSLLMTRLGSDFIRKVSAPVSAGQQYKYIFQPGTIWKPDARSRAQNPNNYDNSFLIDPGAYSWGDVSFQIPGFEDMVIYELHVGTFSGRNDGLNRMGRFRDIVDRHLDHLQYLGINVVELMPIAEFDYYESWGYNPVAQWAPENAYGSPEDLKYTIDRLHQAGMAVVLDVCYNHFSPTGNYLWYYDGTQHYFDSPAVQTPWGSQADFDRLQVRDYFADNILYWLEEYHVDGFRMDATRYMRDNFIYPEGQPSGWSLMQRINDQIDRRRADAISIAEELPNDPWITYPTSAGGAGFDAQWHDAFGDNLRQELAAAAYGDPQMWRIRDAIMDADFPDAARLVRYVESHDEAAQARLGVLLDSSDPYSIWARGRAKLAQGLTLFVPGIPMFLMGGEWLEETPFGSGWNNRIDWSKAVSRAPIVRFFRDAIAVRRGNGGLRADAGCEVHHVDDSANVLAFHRWDMSGNDLVIVASLNNSDLYNYRVGFPQPGRWFEILNSQAVEYLGNGAGNGGFVDTQPMAWDGMPYSATLTIPQMGLLVFRYNHPPDRIGDCNCDGFINAFDIDPFVLALTDPAGYTATYPNCNLLNADANGDRTVNSFDIDPFVELLTGN
jgi:1,4-alpha-glucan branching enzyme